MTSPVPAEVRATLATLQAHFKNLPVEFPITGTTAHQIREMVFTLTGERPSFEKIAFQPMLVMLDLFIWADNAFTNL